MTWLFVLLLVLQGPDCTDWRECRAQALEAASRGEYEAFHDLAWRAAQKGPPRDSDLMYLVARAQALSGRPSDALVMLRRLAEMGVPTDAVSSDEFERVRALAGWADVAALTATSAAPSPSAPGPEKGLPAPRPRTPWRTPCASTRSPSSPRGSLTTPSPGGSSSATATHASCSSSTRGLGGPTICVGAASAGFYAIAGLDIDPRRGDLSVVSVEEGQPGAAAAHRLQLVSGRA